MHCSPQKSHCIKRVRIRSSSSPRSVRMPENVRQISPAYGRFSRSALMQ